MKKVGISILVLFFIFDSVSAYNQDNTHPALTDEIVDFYNLSYPDDSISEEFKQEMIKGAVQEDSPPRWFNHFYDPVYKEGWLGYRSSKEWARSSVAQQTLIGLAAIGSLEGYGDFSYERAIKDYATGNKKRAFRALGHVLHLLEDANVPEHTRNDTHIPFVHSTKSPYESVMAKWGPFNTNITKPLFDERVRPVIFDNIDKYFDEVALYSNNYFFSEDTINIPRYKNPEIQKRIIEIIDGEPIPYALGRDVNGELFHLVRGNVINWRNFAKEQKVTTNDSLVLDDYWERLTKNLIPHGVGLVKLFIEQAKAAEKLYSERKIEEQKQGLFERIFGAINPFDREESKIKNQNEQTATEIISLVLSGQVPLEPAPVPQPRLLPQSNNQLVQITPTPTPFRLQTTPSPTPQISPSPSPSPTPRPSPSPSPTPKPSPTPTSTPTPESLASCPDPALKTNSPLRHVVLNEIAWMGTEASTADEWIELKNNAGQEVDLNCWQIIAEDGTPKIKINSADTKNTKNTKISLSGYYLLERTDDNTISDIPADQIYTGALGNPGEILKLYDKDGNLQDIVGHKDASGAVVPWYAGDNTTKSSMERRSSNASGDQSSSWQNNDGITKNGIDAAGYQIKGTPKAQNSTGTVSLGGGGGGGGGGSSSSSESSSDSGGDSGGGKGGSETPLFKIVINEIAWMGTAADFNDEWIELHNPSSQSMNVGNWTLKSFKIKDGILASDSPNIVLATKSIDPFSYFLLERTDDTAISDIAADQFFTGALDNPGEILELRDSTGQLQDKVGHLVSSSSVSPWYAGENDTSTTPPTRKTMERVDPKIAGTVSTNWKTNDGTLKNGKDKGNNQILGTPRKINSVQLNQKPDKITDLALDSNATSLTKIKLNWTAKSDSDSAVGDLSYDLRYATVSFGSTASEQALVWSSAVKVASSSLPQVAAALTAQSSSFNVWQYNSTAYFAIKVFDGKSYSDLSNAVSYTISSALANAVWPMFGVNQEHTGQVEVAGPTTSASQEFFDFSQFDPINQPIQPVIAPDSTIYLGYLDGGSGNLAAIDNTGQLKWKWPQSGTFTIARPSTPAVLTDNGVYFGLATNHIGAVSSNSSQRWIVCTVLPDCNGLVGPGLFTIDSKGNLYFAEGNQHFVVYKPDGTLKWKINFHSQFGTNVYEFFGQTPVIDEDTDTLYLAAATTSGFSKFFSLPLSGGTENWQTVWPNTSSGKSLTSPISFDKAGNKLYAAIRNGVVEINPQNGVVSLIWAPDDGDAYFRQPKSQVSIDSINNALLVAFDYFSVATISDKASANTKTKIFSFDKTTKAVNWTYEIPLNLSGNMITVDNLGNLYFAAEDIGIGAGKLYSLSKAGSLSWEFDGGSVNQTTHPVIDKDGALYQVFGTKLYKFK